MKSAIQLAAILSLFLSSRALAGTCDEVFSNISFGVNDPTQHVRIVTTLHNDADEIVYTRGYLFVDPNTPNLLTAPSTRYFDSESSTSGFGNASSDQIIIQLLQADGDHVQVNYIIPGDLASSAAYLGQCYGNVISAALPRAVLSVSFQYDEP